MNAGDHNPIGPSEAAYRALDRLTSRFLGNPAISLIDLGIDPQAGPGAPPALRVYVRPGASIEVLGLPDQVDGIPVRILSGDYHLE